MGMPLSRSPPGQRVTIAEFVIGIARIVGFRPTKRQPLPGLELVWKGNREIKLLAHGYTLNGLEDE